MFERQSREHLQGGASKVGEATPGKGLPRKRISQARDTEEAVWMQDDTAPTGTDPTRGHPAGETKDDPPPLPQSSLGAHPTCLQEGWSQSCLQVPKHSARTPVQSEDPTTRRHEEGSSVQGAMHGLRRGIYWRDGKKPAEEIEGA